VEQGIDGAGPDGSLSSGDGGLKASVNSLINETFTIGGAGFTLVYKQGDLDDPSQTIYFCRTVSGPGVPGTGVGGTTGRYVVIDWPDAAYRAVFAAKVSEPGTLLLPRELLTIPAPDRAGPGQGRCVPREERRRLAHRAGVSVPQPIGGGRRAATVIEWIRR
jgi:hypothetical protein